MLETRRGVGSFVSRGAGSKHDPRREQSRQLRAFVTRLLADAAAAGFTVDEVLAELGEHRKKGA